MHELSIAKSLVEIAIAEANQVEQPVEAVHIKVGALSGVVPDALIAAYEFVTEATCLEGSLLVIENCPVQIFCPDCNKLTTLPDTKNFDCSQCGKTSGDLRGGRELELTALEVRS
ncbi:MAG TPA: hydrogenase maturation nickel metallochaperone HypA [Candidatus Melainabacteria bacterium]|nr:hydrogenase maturation nickel metallochaperone HypA [Candidatus Melainabacteria bacterium]